MVWVIVTLGLLVVVVYGFLAEGPWSFRAEFRRDAAAGLARRLPRLRRSAPRRTRRGAMVVARRGVYLRRVRSGLGVVQHVFNNKEVSAVTACQAANVSW